MPECPDWEKSDLWGNIEKMLLKQLRSHISLFLLKKKKKNGTPNLDENTQKLCPYEYYNVL